MRPLRGSQVMNDIPINPTGKGQKSEGAAIPNSPHFLNIQTAPSLSFYEREKIKDIHLQQCLKAAANYLSTPSTHALDLDLKLMLLVNFTRKLHKELWNNQ